MARNTVMITGASRGIGHAIACFCQERGYEVIGISRQADENLPWHHYGVDLLADDATDAMAEIIARHQPCRFVGNAGLAMISPLGQLNRQDFDIMMRVNVLALMQTVETMQPLLQKAGFGRIVLIGSRAALGKSGRLFYGASKAAVAGMARTMALELARHGVTVNVVAPGPIDTDMFRQDQPPGSPNRARIEQAIPLGRIGTPAEIAAAVGYFLDDDAGFVTGQTLNICGGLTVGLS